MDAMINEVSSLLGTQRENVPRVVASLKADLERSLAAQRSMGEALVAASIPGILSSAVDLKGVRMYVSGGGRADGEAVGGDRTGSFSDLPLAEDLIIDQGQRAVKADPDLVYIRISPRGESARVVCFVGERAAGRGVSAGSIVRDLAKTLGGSGGGSKTFAQGGGPRVEKVDEVSRMSETVVSGMIG
jgi:alanyl-tRNA synthetase